MKIYWLFLLLATIICFWNESSARITWNGTRYQRKAYWSQAIIFFAVVIFFCGLRSGIADTGTYIQMFKGYPSSISGMDLKSVNKDKGFFVISVLFKQFISNDFHGWLFLITRPINKNRMFLDSSGYGVILYSSRSIPAPGRVHDLDSLIILFSINTCLFPSFSKKIVFAFLQDSLYKNTTSFLIKELIDQGNEVYISLPKGMLVQNLKEMGCHFIETPVDRRGINPATDFKLMMRYFNILGKIKPDLVM